MSIDVTNFHLINVTDTCAVWNILSSATLYQTAKQAKVSFCITSFILYECLVKKRSGEKAHDRELQARLRSCADRGDFTAHEIQLEDLLAPALLQSAGRIGKGELSAIAFAYRTRQAILTDDQKARRLATDKTLAIKTQTTPHLLSWLFYTRRLVDSDYNIIISEHVTLGGPLEPHFKTAYHMALRARCLEISGPQQS